MSNIVLFIIFEMDEKDKILSEQEMDVEIQQEYTSQWDMLVWELEKDRSKINDILK